jgi:hypothetical protein
VAGTATEQGGRQKRKSSLQWQLQILTQKEGIFRKDLRGLLKGSLRDLSEHWKIKNNGSDGEIQQQLQTKLGEVLRDIVPGLHRPYAARSAALFQEIFKAGFNLTKNPAGHTRNLEARKTHMVLRFKAQNPKKRGLSDSTFQRYLWHAIEQVEKQILATGFVPQVPVSVFEKPQNNDPVEQTEGLDRSEEVAAEGDSLVVTDTRVKRIRWSRLVRGKRARLVLALACTVVVVAVATVALKSGLFDSSDSEAGQRTSPGFVDGRPVPNRCQPTLGPLKVGQGNAVHATLSVGTDNTPCWTPIVAPVSSGATFRYMISYQNNSNKKQEKVVVRVSLAPGLLLVPASTYLFNSTNPDGVLIESNNITGGGIVIGGYLPGGGAYVVFSAGFPFNADLKCGGTTDMRSVGAVRPEGMSWYYNTAITQTYKRCG